jgi:signal transduction histidine kinase
MLVVALVIHTIVPIFALRENLAFADLIIHFVTPYLVGICYLAIGIWSFFRGYDQRKALAFAFLCASVSILLATMFEQSAVYVLARIWTAVWSLTGIALFYMGLAILPESSLLQRHKWLRFLPIILGTAITIWAEILLNETVSRSSFFPWFVLYIFLTTSILAFIGMLVYAWLRPSYVRVRLQSRVIFFSTIISLAPTGIWAITLALGRVLPTLERSHSLQVLTNFVFLTLFPVAVDYSLRRYRSLDADLLTTPFYQGRQDYRIVLRDFSRELATSLDLDYILDKLLLYVGMSLRPRHILIFTLSDEGDYELQMTWGEVDDKSARAVRFTLQDKLLSRLRRDGESLPLTPKIIQDLHLEPEERARLDCLDVVLLSPLKAKERLLGILALGPIKSGDLYAADDIALLNTMTYQAAVAAETARLYAQQVDQEQRLVQQTRRLTDILALGNELKSLDRDIVVRSTVAAVHQSLGFELVTLSLVEEDDPTRVRVVAWAGIESTTWERLAATSFPLIDFENTVDVQKLENCYFIYASGSIPEISTRQKQVPWHEGDQLFVPLTTSEELLGYLTVDQPEDGLRPTEYTLEVLEIFANQAAIAIQNANLYANIDRALDERVAELATLQEIDTQLNVKLDFNHVMDTTLEWAMRITFAVAGTLSLVSEDRQTLQVVSHRGYPPEMNKYWAMPWSVQEGIMGYVVRISKPVMIEDVTKDADYVDTTTSTRSHLAAPITREEMVIGVISLESAEPSGFSADHLAFLTRLADHAAMAIENARLYEETNRRVAELSALQQISLDVTSSLKVSAVLDSIAANTQTLTQADQVTIYLYDAHEDALFFGAGLSQRGKEERPPVPVRENKLSMTVARRSEAIVIHDASQHPLLSDASWQVGAIASIPLRKADHILGVFDISFQKAHTFTRDELRALNLLADQAAIAIENAQLYADVQRANEAKGEFVSIVSHELKVPMTSIQGYARLLSLGAVGAVTEQQLEFVNIILRSVERMSDLVRDLLDLARIESGRINIVPRPIDMVKVVQDAIRSVRNEIEARDHQIEIDIPDDLPGVRADPTRLMQVWTNLISNAYKYTPSGGLIKTWVRPYDSYDPESENGQWVICAVEDNGIGIAPEDQERIFEQFYRVRRQETSDEPGTGLGLSITQSIVELHGGHIWVESALDQGSTFYFTLPTG